MGLVLSVALAACAGSPGRQDPPCTGAPSSSTASPSAGSTSTTPAATPTTAAKPPASVAGRTTSPGAATFPLHAQAGRPYLLDAHQQPFLITGDAGWSLIAELSTAQAQDYLRTRRAQGFNTVLVSLLEHEFATKAPANIDGERPFVDSAFGTPNERYFAHADQVIQMASELGFLVLLTPAYAGYDGGDEGWYSEMVAAGPDRLRQYGRWVGARYAANDHILWVQGGDFDVPQQDLVDAVAEGIAATDPGALQTYHAARRERMSQHWGDRSWLTVDNVYTDEEVLPEVRRTFEKSTRPFFLIEAVYEHESDADTRTIRRQAWQAVLGGAGGQVYGNSPMWSFGAQHATGTSSWQRELDSPGAQSIGHLATILGRLPWWQLCPDSSAELLDEPSNSGDDPVAAFDRDTGIAVLYLPQGGAPGLHLGALGRGTISLTWYDPTSGRTVDGGQHSSAADLTTVEPPGPNDGGDPDWVLVAQRT